ncbi:hypothetical protein [Sphaerisporangium corydalis]|uniref:Uncharacterized protein n=1 Tax=Sphaerisporangium corydalis TaxID=1441875 RepID=A0ABV9E9E9_9ACTN|nr:hypothetical protein [Sphaerisporangium corydalis]
MPPTPTPSARKVPAVPSELFVGFVPAPGGGARRYGPGAVPAPVRRVDPQVTVAEPSSPGTRPEPRPTHRRSRPSRRPDPPPAHRREDPPSPWNREPPPPRRPAPRPGPIPEPPQDRQAACAAFTNFRREYCDRLFAERADLW